MDLFKYLDITRLIFEVIMLAGLFYYYFEKEKILKENQNILKHIDKIKHDEKKTNRQIFSRRIQGRNESH